MTVVETLDRVRPFENLTAVRTLVSRFENASLSQGEWNHRAHLTVAAWYLLKYEEDPAVEKVISGIRHFNRVNGIEQTRTGGYHETLTRFWIAVVKRFLTGLPEDLTLLARINSVVNEYEGRGHLILDYYSPDRIWSWKARLRWVEPDLKPL